MKIHGFTLIELMVTISLVLIVLLLVVPSFSDLFSSSRTRSAADIVFSSLIEARSEAIKRNVTVTATISASSVALSGGGWTKTVAIPSSIGGTVTISSDTVPFNSSGQESNLATHNIQITSAQCTANNSCYTIEVFGGGYVKTCNPSQVNTNAANFCATS